MKRALLICGARGAGAARRALPPVSSSWEPAPRSRRSPPARADPCRAIYQVTGYQGRSANLKNPFFVRRDGYIVAFTVTLPEAGRQPDRLLQRALRRVARGAPRRRAARGPRARRANHRLLRQSEVFDVRGLPRLEPHVRAQASRSGFGRGTSWRSRSPPGCPPSPADLPPATGGAPRGSRASAAATARWRRPRAGGAARGRPLRAAPTSARGCSTRPRTCRIPVRPRPTK